MGLPGGARMTKPRRKTLAILTNAGAADQRSMIGYGEMLIEAAQQSEHDVVEFRPVSLFGGWLPKKVQGPLRRLASNLDRFILTPLTFAGKRADIVVVVDPGNVVYLPLIRHRRSITVVHDMIPYLARDKILLGWRPSLTGRWLMKRIMGRLSHVDHIVCVSHATKRDLLFYVRIPEDRVSVIHNAVFQPMAPARPEACAEMRMRLAIPPGAPLILHIGRNFYKSRETVLEVVARVREALPDVRLVMVGALTPALKAQAALLALDDALHVFERVPPADMATLYTTASVLLFPSLYEGFGLPVLEAQMCRLPVVCTGDGALAEVAGDGAYVCRTRSREEMISAVVSVLTDPERRNELIVRGQRNTSRFRYERWKSTFDRLWMEII